MSSDDHPEFDNGPPMEGSRAGAVAVRTEAVWIGPTHRPLMAWLSRPFDGMGSTGVVIIPPLGYEQWTTHRTLRTVAEQLAAQGCSVVRIDLDGTWDSAGDAGDPDRLAAWRRSVGDAAAFLRANGTTSLILVGVRFGATLALLEGHALGADRVVAWAPVVRGRAYVRELQLIALPIPEDLVNRELAGGLVLAGSPFGPQTLADVRACDLAALTQPPAPEVLIVDRDDRPPSNALLEHLAELGVDTDHIVVGGSVIALDVPTEYAEVAGDVVERICLWVGHSTVPPEPSPVAAATVARFSGMSEEVLRLGSSGLVGVVTEPEGDRRATVVWLNSGSEAHVGPGRAWVEFARSLGADGFASVRLDFSGWGESPDLGHAPGRAYDEHCTAEVSQVVEALRNLGHERIIVVGLCAGAYVALESALVDRLDGVIALNPQLYWQRGDPVEADIIKETRVRRQGEIRRFKALRRLGVWSALDALGVRHPAAQRLRKLCRGGTPVLMLFAEGDDGLEFLEDRVGRSWSRTKRRGSVTERVIPDIDHSMHQTWRRGAVLDAMLTWLNALPVGRPDA